MKLRDIKPLNEYRTGTLQQFDVNHLKQINTEAKTINHHLVLKDGGPTAIFKEYKFDEKNRIFLLVDRKEQQKIYAYTVIKQLKSNVWQPADTFLAPAFRGLKIVNRMYRVLSHYLNSWFINGKQLSPAMAKAWGKFENKKIYQLSTNNFFELTDKAAKLPEEDEHDDSEQDWFYAIKELSNLTENYNYMGELFHYDKFINGEPGFGKDDKWLDFIPMTI